MPKLKLKLKILQPKTRSGYIRTTKTGDVAFVPPHQQGYWVNPQKEAPKDGEKLASILEEINGEKNFNGYHELKRDGVEAFIHEASRVFDNHYSLRTAMSSYDIFPVAAAYLLAKGEQKYALEENIRAVVAEDPRWGFGIYHNLIKLVGRERANKIMKDLDFKIDDPDEYAIKTLNNWVSGSSDTFTLTREGLTNALATKLGKEKHQHPLADVAERIYKTTQEVIKDPDVREENGNFEKLYRGMTVVLGMQETIDINWGKLFSTTVDDWIAKKFARANDALSKIPRHAKRPIKHKNGPYAEVKEEVKYIPEDPIMGDPEELSILFELKPKTERQIVAVLHGKGLDKTIKKLGGRKDEHSWFEHEKEVVTFL